MVLTKKKDKDGREGKARRCCLEDRIELIKFLASLAILHQDDLKKGVNSSYSSYGPGPIYPFVHIFLLQNS